MKKCRKPGMLMVKPTRDRTSPVSSTKNIAPVAESVRHTAPFTSVTYLTHFSSVNIAKKISSFSSISAAAKTY